MSLSVHVKQDLTGLESMDQCRRTLEQHNWNIEVRIQCKRQEHIRGSVTECLWFPFCTSLPLSLCSFRPVGFNWCTCICFRLQYKTDSTSRKECPVCLTHHPPGRCRSIQQTIEYIVTSCQGHNPG